MVHRWARWCALTLLAGALFGALVVYEHAGTPLGYAQAATDEVVSGVADVPLVALTFDAGGVAGPAARVLAVLRERDVRATFFLSGQWIESYPQLAAQIGADGHELANHTYAHPDLRGLSNDRIAWELQFTDALIESATGRSPVPYFRPPFGARDARVVRVAGALGYRSIMWALDSADWRTDATRAGVASRVLRLARAGDVVVMHVASTATAAALGEILDGLAARGLQVVTVTEVLNGRVVGPPADDTRAMPDDVAPLWLIRD